MDTIYSYTDKDAVADGVLIPLTDRCRVTRAVFDFIESRVSKRVPLQWPLGPNAAAMFPLVDKPEWRTRALLNGLLEHYASAAIKIYDDGSIWHAYLDATGSDINAIRPGSREGQQLWIMPNELGGLTIMFPEDY